MTAEEIASNLQPLVNLSKEIPFAKIPDYIEEKKKEIARLDGEIRKLKEDIKILERTKEDLKIEISTAKELGEAALQEEQTTYAKISEFSNLKSELEKYGLNINHENIPKFVKLIKNLSDKGFNVKEITLEFQDLQSLELKLGYLSNRVNELLNQKLILEQKKCYT